MLERSTITIRRRFSFGLAVAFFSAIEHAVGAPFPPQNPQTAPAGGEPTTRPAAGGSTLPSCEIHWGAPAQGLVCGLASPRANTVAILVRNVSQEPQWFYTMMDVSGPHVSLTSYARLSLRDPEGREAKGTWGGYRIDPARQRLLPGHAVQYVFDIRKAFEIAMSGRYAMTVQLHPTWNKDLMLEGPPLAVDADPGGQQIVGTEAIVAWRPDNAHVTLSIAPEPTASRPDAMGTSFPARIDVGRPRAPTKVLVLSVEVQAERDRLLKQADHKLREGLKAMAKDFPPLRTANNKGLEKALDESDSPEGTISFWVGRATWDSKAPWKAESIRPEQAWSLMVYIGRPPGPDESPRQMAEFPLYEKLGLVGQIDASAGDPKLDAALKKLLCEALAPLGELEKKMAT